MIKIIYDPRIKNGLIEFGIKIPVSNDKAKKAFEHLKAHPLLGRYIRDWHIEKVREKISKKDLLRVHSQEYVNKLFSDKLEQEIISTYELIDKNGNPYRYDPAGATLPLSDLFKFQTLKKAAGSYQCLKTAMKSGFCFYFGGGSHHAKRDYGEGFCLVNDIVIAIRKLQALKKINSVWIIDVDAHKGDGTACITQGDDSVKTLSIHMATGWPLDSPEYDKNGLYNPSWTPSDIDIGIEKGADSSYVSRLRSGLSELEKTFKPDLAVVVLGADPYEKDELASTKDLALTLEQMLERDLLIYNFLKQRNIPQAHLAAGGYGESSWKVYAQFFEYVLVEQYSKKKSA
jgi:acetoin utilization deacetylase AcuC-like enzyme